jgi:hypothetical protein
VSGAPNPSPLHTDATGRRTERKPAWVPERTSLGLCFEMFDINIYDTLMFDEMVQIIYMFRVVVVLCGKTNQKEAGSTSPGRIFRAEYLQNIRPDPHLHRLIRP